MRNLLLTMLFVFGTRVLFAQQTTGTITGTVTDPQAKPLEAAVVSLLAASDSALVKVSITDASGKYAFEAMVPGSYLVLVNNLGYNRYISSVVVLQASATILELPVIRLQQSQANVLKEVTVTGQRAIVEQKIDRTVVNVGAMVSSAGATALDVLEKSPGVRVDDNGVISLKGKAGVVVFVDDKPTYLSGAGLESYLKALSAETLEQIEIMANPPAKYEAAGNAGVINIKTKKSLVKSFNGSINLSYGRGKYGKANNSLNLNYRNNKYNLFGNLSFADQENFADLDIERRYKNEAGQLSSVFSQNSYIRRGFSSYNAKIGFDYYATEKTTVGAVFTGLLRPSQNRTYNTSNLSDSQNQLDSVLIADNYSEGDFKNGGVNLNFRHQYDKTGKALSADLDFIVYNTDAEQLYKNYTYLPSRKLKSSDALTGNLPASIKIYTAKTDYTHPLENGLKIETGAKLSYIETDNLTQYNRTMDQVTKPDYDLSNHFTYQENISAAYVNFSRTMGLLGVQAGARLEHTSTKGHQLGNAARPDSSFSRSYTNVFPTAFVSYKFDEEANNQLVLSYGKRIDRPYFQDLNPFLSPLDKLTYYSGNPFLQPTFSHNLELSHTFKNMITTSFRYSVSHDLINETIEMVGSHYYSRPGNIGRGESRVVSVNGNFSPFKWLTSNLYTEYSYNKFKGQLYTQQLKSGGDFFYASLNNQMKFGKGWGAELGGLYRTDLTYTQFVVGGYWQMNAGLQKSLFSNKATLKLNVADVFYTRVNKGTINNLQQTEAWYNNVGDTRVGTLSFSYRFGKAGTQRSRSTGGSESEQNRVRS